MKFQTIAAEIFKFVAKRGTVNTKDIRDALNITEDICNSILAKLIEVGFLEWVEQNRTVKVSELIRELLEE